jgi:hypothetical protein
MTLDELQGVMYRLFMHVDKTKVGLTFKSDLMKREAQEASLKAAGVPDAGVFGRAAGVLGDKKC